MMTTSAIDSKIDILFPRCGYSVPETAARHLLYSLPDDLEPRRYAMSRPRSDYDPRRFCLNPFPFLEKLNLGKHRRTFGVYLAGGLVSPPPRIHPSLS